MAPGNEPPNPPPSDKLTSALPSYPTGFKAAPPPPSPPPPAPEQVQAPPPESIPLQPAPPPAPMTAADLAHYLRRLNIAMIPLVLALAFLVACFAIDLARNSDFLMHLATGRWLADGFGKGEFGNLFGKEPFAHTTAGVYWVNHSWLFDLIVYGLFLTVGVAGLIVIKGVLTALLAWVLLQIRRPGQSWWAPAACAGLAVLAVSPRLLYQPTIVSYLFLGLTLLLLARRETLVPAGARDRQVALPPRRHLWLLPPLFLLWVNLDNWFLLGPITVALFLLGDWLQESLGPHYPGAEQPNPLERRRLALVLLVGLLACLINPHHVRAFTLPPQLPVTEPATLLRQDPYFQGAYLSPLQSVYFQKHIGLSVAGMSYYALVGVGLVSFALNGGPNLPAAQTGWRWWRAVVWGAFFLLSAWHMRAVPFFAVVAGPIAALNLQDFAVRAYGTEPRLSERWKIWSLGGRAVTLLAGVVLLLLAWPGWLQAVPHELRRVSFDWVADPSLERAAHALRQWREAGLLRDGDRGLNLRPEVANYFAWFAPEEKGFFDHRTQPFQDSAGDYLELRQAFHPDEKEVEERWRRGTAPAGKGDFPWQKILRERGIRYVILYRESRPTLLWFFADPEQWTPWYLDDRRDLVVLGWNDPAEKSRDRQGAEPRYDPNRLAFGPKGVARQAPAQRPAHAAQPPPEWWEQYLYGPRRPLLSADEPDLHLLYLESQGPRRELELRRVWQAAYAASLPALAALPPLAMLGPAYPADYVFALPTDPSSPRRSPAVESGARELFVNYYLTQDHGPPGSPWLTIRAARQALAEDPNDPTAHRRLLAGYSALNQFTRARLWLPRVPLLRTMRQIQFIFTFKQILVLQPENPEVHLQLASTFDPERLGYLDLAVKHYDEAIRLFHEKGPRRAEDAEEFNKQLKQLEERRDAIKKAVEASQNEFEVGAAKMNDPLQKARYARDRGLADQAFQVLLPTIKELSPQQAQFTLGLLLNIGEVEQVREVLTDRFKDQLGTINVDGHPLPAYDWFRFVVAAVSGDYAEADRILAQLDKQFEQQAKSALTQLLAGKEAGQFPPGPDLFAPSLAHAPMTIWSRFQRLYGWVALAQFPFGRVQGANLKLLRGLLALEGGDTELAARQFEQAVSLAPSADYLPHACAAYFLRLLQENR